MENNHFALLVILILVVSLIRVNCQNHKPRYKIAAILPVLEEDYNNSTAIYESGCSKKLRDDALLTVEALYYAFDFVKKNVSHKFDLDIEVIETCGNKLTNLEDFSKLYNEMRVNRSETQPLDSEYHNASFTLKGVIYSNEYGPFDYDRLFRTMNLIQCSITGPLNKTFNTDELVSIDAIFSTSGHFFILDVMFKILKHQNWKHVFLMNPLYLDDDRFDDKYLKKRAKTLAERHGVCLSSANTFFETSVNVIICFCNGNEIMELKKLLKNIKEEALEKKI